MPVSAKFPTRLCVDVDALTTRRPELEDALLAAFSRTFALARHEVVEPRGGYMGVKLEVPTFVWTGDGLEETPDTLRAEIETLVDAALWRAANEAGIFDFARAADRTPAVLRTDRRELVDPERDEDALGLYWLPSYQKQGKLVAVPKKGKRVRQDAGDEVTEALAWRKIRTGKGLTAKDLQAALKASLAALGRKLPTTGQFGVIYQIGQNFGIEVVELPGAKLIFSGEMPSPSRPQVQAGKPLKMVKHTLAIVQSGAKLTWYGPGTTLAERIKAFTDFHGDALRVQILAKAKKAGQVAAGEIKDQLDVMIQENVQEAVKGIPECNFLTLELGSARYLFYVPTTLFGADVLKTLDTELLPLVEWREVNRKTGKDGKAGARQGEGKGDGKGGEGKAGQAAGVGTGVGIGEGGDEGSEGPGAIVYSEEKGDGKTGRLYPPSYYIGFGVQDCSAFLGEPDLGQLGEAGEHLRAMIQEIAQKLQIQPCEHAGRFAINAAGAISSRAATVGEHAARSQDKGFTQPGSASESAQRKLLFVPTVSPAIQFMRFLAGVVPLLARLDDAIRDVYWANSQLIQGMYAGNGVGWFLHYRYDFSDNMKLGVTFIFLSTCRALLLQLLRSSHDEIMKRINNFESYAPMFEELARSQLLAVAELLVLHGQLKSEIDGFSVGAVVRGVSDTWADARLGLEGLFEAAAGRSAPVINRTPGVIVRDASGKPTGISDSMGHLWTLQRLEQAIQLRRGSAEAVDPLIKQLTDIPEVAARMRANPFYLRVELYRLLLEMKSNNEDQTSDAVGSVMHAFRVSRIDEITDASKHTIYNAPYAFTGIHLMAHNQVGEFFGGSVWYAEGIKSLFNAELGLKDLGTFFEWTGLILLGVLCPPAAFAVGAAVATYHYYEATEKEELFRSLINPDELMSWAEVEAELFAARLGLVLSFIPEAGTILRAGTRVASVAARKGVGQGAKLAARAMRARFSKDIAQSLAKGVERAILREVVTDQVMGKLFEQILGPINQAIAADAALSGPAGGRSAVLRVMMAMEAEQTRLAGPALAEDS